MKSWRQKRGVFGIIKRELRRRSAIEAVIGHMKTDGHLGRCYLKGRQGDAANAILTAVGYNLRLLLACLALFSFATRSLAHSDKLKPEFVDTLVDFVRSRPAQPVDAFLAQYGADALEQMRREVPEGAVMAFRFRPARPPLDDPRPSA